MTVPSELLPTGVAGLDMILGGGLSRDALVFIVAPPGAGKTILASQILFSAVRAGASGLLLSAFSEDHSKLLSHLRAFSFFDDGLVGTRIQLMTLAALVSADGQFDSRALIATVQQTSTRIIVIDGFQGAPDLFAEPIAVRRLVVGLARLAQVLRVTVLITMEGDGRSPQYAPQLTMADVVIDLDYRVDGWRHVRRLDVVKQRGHPALDGLHAYTITAAGVITYPRLEARRPAGQGALAAGVMPFGLPSLDALLEGGLPAGAISLLTAAPGAGKTTLALRWALAEARPEAGTVYVSFHSDARQLQIKARVLGLDLTGAIARGACTLIHLPPVAIDPDQVAAALLDALRPTTQRVVIDDLGGLLWELGPRARDYLAALGTHLAHAGATTLMVLETEPSQLFRLDQTYTMIAPIAETVLVLEAPQGDEQPRHTVRLLTMRFGRYSARPRGVELEPLG